MSSAFIDTHNMVAILTKSNASEGFDQILNFLNGSYIKYALTVNPHIYVSCIKQFWNTVTVKQSADVTRLQALVDKKKVLISEAVIRDVLRLDDAEGVDCQPNEEIFTELARMGYEKPYTKLTFYKAFFLSQWKFLIHTILQSLSAKRISLNEFSSAMASVVICLSTGRKFNFSKYIFDSLVRNVDNSSKFYMYPRERILRVETPLFEGMIVVQENMVEGIADEQVQDDDAVTTAPEDVTAAKGQKVKVFKLKRLKKVGTSQRVKTSDDTLMEDVSNQGRMIVELDRDEGIELMGEKEEKKKDIADDDQAEGRHAEIQAEKQAEIYQIDMDHAAKVLSMHEEESTEVKKVVEVVTTAKLITEVVTAFSAPVSAASTIISAAEPNIPAVTVTAALVKVEMDEAYARKLHEELNQDIDWDVAIEHVKEKAKEDPFIQRYQVMKKRPQTEAQARRNMITYLKNIAGFRLDFFKGMSYDDIRLIFEAKFNAHMEFLLKSKEQIEEEANRALESINKTPAKKAAKRRRLNKEDKDVEEIKQHLEIVPDEDDDLYASFITVLKNFDRDDLETLWSIVKERFSTSKPNNFSDEYLLTTLRTMFGRPDGQDNIWKSQRTLELMLLISLKKNTKCFNAAGEELSVVKHKLMLLDTAAERS
nr:hypothetical protein [Tanacetum cinerariifolium]